MSEFTNLPPKDASKTQEYFDNYFAQTGNVNTNVYEALIAFFEKQTNNKEVARAILSGLIKTSIEKNIDLRELADQFKNMSAEDINRYVVTVLNMSRKNSSYLGFKNNIKSSQYILRSILP